MPIDPYVVRWVGNHHLGNLTFQQAFIGFRVLCITADQAMAAEVPNVTQLRYGGSGGRQIPQVVGRIAGRVLRRTVDQ
jgi:hypothetical protein